MSPLREASFRIRSDGVPVSMLTVEIPVVLHESLRDAANKAQISLSTLIRAYLGEGLDKE